MYPSIACGFCRSECFSECEGGDPVGAASSPHMAFTKTPGGFLPSGVFLWVAHRAGQEEEHDESICLALVWSRPPGPVPLDFCLIRTRRRRPAPKGERQPNGAALAAFEVATGTGTRASCPATRARRPGRCLRWSSFPRARFDALRPLHRTSTAACRPAALPSAAPQGASRDYSTPMPAPEAGTSRKVRHANLLTALVLKTLLTTRIRPKEILCG